MQKHHLPPRDNYILLVVSDAFYNDIRKSKSIYLPSSNISLISDVLNYISDVILIYCIQLHFCF